MPNAHKIKMNEAKRMNQMKNERVFNAFMKAFILVSMRLEAMRPFSYNLKMFTVRWQLATSISSPFEIKKNTFFVCKKFF